MIRRLLRALALLLLILLVWQVAEVLTWRSAANPLPLPAGWKKGAYHIHSTFSDGGYTPGEIAAAAAADGLDFVVLTDHGRPNREAELATAWRGRVLVVGGSELSLDAGHLTAIGVPLLGYRLPPEAGEAIPEVNRAGGASFIAHPCDSRIPWTQPNAEGYGGIEIISAYDAARRRFLLRLPLFPLQYLINADYALTALFRYPGREIELWDTRLRRGPCSGIYALDAHSRLRLPGGAVWRFPSARVMLRIATVYLKAGTDWSREGAPKAAADAARALRDGRFFSCFESLAPANGFDFYFRSADGRRAGMGERSPTASGELVLKTPFHMAVDVRLVHDGRAWVALSGMRREEIVIPVSAPGSYRAEVFLSKNRFSDLPWILANPVYLGTPLPAPSVRKFSWRGKTPLSKSSSSGWFGIEKNSQSRARLEETMAVPSLGILAHTLDFSLRPGRGSPDYWAALAHRSALIDITGRRGIAMVVRATPRLRAWLQLRFRSGAGESVFQHSFAADETWRDVFIPFQAFRHLYGPLAAPPADRLSGLIITVDNGLAWPGAAGRLSVSRIALYD